MHRKINAVAAAVLVAHVALAQGRSDTLPIRQLGRIIARSADSIGAGDIRPLSNGHILANDRIAHRVMLLDDSLRPLRSVIDTVSSTSKAYGSRQGTLIPYTADSTLYLDAASMAFVIIDAAGNIVRTAAAPSVGGLLGLNYLMTMSPRPGFDGRGSIVYQQKLPLSNLGRTFAPGFADFHAIADSSPIIRLMLSTHERDTVTYVALPPLAQSIRVGGADTIATPIRIPYSLSDPWTVLHDGTIAVVRMFDYHIDWIAPNGQVDRSPPIAHAWERVSDAARTAVIDSMERADSVAQAQMQAALDSARIASAGRVGGVGAGAGAGGGGSRGALPAASSPLDAPRATHTGVVPTTVRGGAGGLGATMTGTAVSLVQHGRMFQLYPDPTALPDYWPAVAGNVVADADGRIWIAQSYLHQPAGGTVYDVVDRQGKLVDRVQIPGGTTVVGFGPGVVYLTSRVGVKLQLAVARIR